MRFLKRAGALVLAGLLLLSLAACGGKSNEKQGLTEVTLCLDWTPNTTLPACTPPWPRAGLRRPG